MAIVHPDDPPDAAPDAGDDTDPALRGLLDDAAGNARPDWTRVREESGLDERVVRALELIDAIGHVHRRAREDDDAELSGSASQIPPPDARRATPAPSDGVPWGPLIRLEAVGGGTGGTVYRAWDPALEHQVALKLIDLSHLPAAERQRASRDARLLARIRHPNVVTVHGAREMDGELGVWMDFVEGRTLHEIVRREGQLSAQEAALIGERLCDALAAVHGAGVLHRDIKAENVMRRTGGEIVLIDFGAGDDGGPAAVAGASVAGTPLYMAPELFAGGHASVASDIYSLGVLLFYLVTGTFPVNARSTDALAAKHAAGRRVLLSDVRPGLPRHFVRVVERALAVNPAERYPSAGAMLADLGQPASPVPPVSRTTLWLAGALAAALLPFVAGQLTSALYNDALGRVQGFASDDVVTTWTIGRQVMFAPAVYMLLTYLLCRTGQRLCGAVAESPAGRWRVVRGCRRLADRAGRILQPSRAPADLLLAGQVAAIAALCVLFSDVLAAVGSDLSNASPEVFAPLRAGADQRHAYRYLFSVATLGMTLAWVQVLRRHRERVSMMSAGAGLALIGLTVVLLIGPCRLMFMSTGQRVDYGDMRCYVTGSDPREQPRQYLLYCPDAPLPKVRVVPAVDPRLHLHDRHESIFSPA